MFSQKWEEFLFASSDEGIVVALVHAGFDVPVSLAYLDELFHFNGGVVGEPKILKFPLLIGVVNCPGSILERCLAIWYVQEDGLHTSRLKGIERLPDAEIDLRGLVVPG